MASIRSKEKYDHGQIVLENAQKHEIIRINVSTSITPFNVGKC